MSDRVPVVVDEQYRPGGERYQRTGRYPTGWAGHYTSQPEVTDASLSEFLTSPEVSDRIAAYLYLYSHQARLPEVWVVIEDPNTSPNLLRTFGSSPREPRTIEYAVRWHAWSAHVDEADAMAWAEMFQVKTDADCAAHPHWGPEARRIFTVVRAAGASVGQLRQPGAEPWTEAFR